MAGGGVPYRGVFYFDTILLSFACVVLSCSSFARYEKRDGGLFVVPRPVVCPLVAVVDGVADGDGVPIDGVCGSGDREHVVFGSNEVIGLGGGDGMVGLVDVLVIGLVGAGADGAGIGLRHHIVVSFRLFPLDIYKIPRYGKPYIQKRSTTQHRHKCPRRPSISRLALRLVLSVSQGVSYSLSSPCRLVSSRPSSLWQAGNIVSVSYRNAPFSEAHSSLPTNTKRNTARAMGFLFTFRPTPSRRLSFICGSQSIPRPQAEG